jgi:acetyl-CoA acetyltransferase family protein
MNESVIVDIVRTPDGRRGGSLAGMHAVKLFTLTLNKLFERNDIDPAIVDDHICGCCSKVGEQALNVARNGWLGAGLPESVSCVTIDRQCGSSQDNVRLANALIKSGACDVVVASGIEHMTRVPLDSDWKGIGDPFGPMWDRYGERLIQMGYSAELIAHKWGISRSEQDELGARSHERCYEAQKAGKYDHHTFPVSVTLEDGSPYILTADEGVRYPVNREKVASLKPAFYDEKYDKIFPGQIDWTVTAANSSQISDAACAALLMNRDKAVALGLKPRARVVAECITGSDPIFQLTGPIPCTQKIFKESGMSFKDLGVVEVNEAFASVVCAWKKELEVDDAWFDANVNPNGGAIAIGHPLGASGGRVMADLLEEMERRECRFGLQVMCEFMGMSNATIFERLD